MISIIDQVIYSIYFALFGLFIGVYLDFTILLINNIKKKYLVYLIEAIAICLLGYISIEFIYINTSGYIPIYIFLFFLLGWFIYYRFIMRDSHNNIIMIKKVWKKLKINSFVTFIFKELFYSKEIFGIIRKRILKRKKKNEEDNISTNDINNDINNGRMYQ